MLRVVSELMIRECGLAERVTTRSCGGPWYETTHMLTIRPDGTVHALAEAGQERVCLCSKRRRFLR